VEHSLAPAFDEGLLVTEPGAHEAVRFRHDRIREGVLAAVDTQPRRGLQLAMARRLAGVPELFAVAAEQYMAVIDAIDDAAERQVVVGLLRRSAEQAALTGDHALVEAMLAAAARLVDPGETATLVEVHTGRHAALYSIGRRRGIPHHRAAVDHGVGTRGRDVRSGPQPDPPEPFRGGDRPGHRVVA
jgi:hypothetical protein